MSDSEEEIGGFYIFSNEKNDDTTTEEKQTIVGLVVFKEILPNKNKYFYHCRVKDNTILPEDSIFLEKLIKGKVNEDNKEFDKFFQENKFEKYEEVFTKYFIQSEPISTE